MMLEKVKNFVRAFRPTRPLDCKHIAKASGSWITQNIPQHFSPPAAKRAALIEARASATEAAGERPLWEGYASVKHYPRSTTGGRSSNQVRTDERMGAFFTWLAAARAPETVVEIGTAFGVSGMYWLDGLELAGQGHLFTFDPNTDWASFARENLAAISDRVTMVSGTFEENASKALVGRNVNIAFIDAIHTSEFVYAQYAMLAGFGAGPLSSTTSASDGGGACAGLLIDQQGKSWDYQAAGMQSLVDAVRSTGAVNLILSPGVAFSGTLDHWLEFRPHDRLARVAASWHTYDFNSCVTASCWDSQIAPAAAQVPLITGEFGEGDCGTGYITPLLSWLDAHQASYLGWAWNVSTCKGGPDLITDFSGTPSAYGAGYRDHLARHPEPSPAPRL